MEEFFPYGSFSVDNNGSETDSQVSPDHTFGNVSFSERSIVAESPRYNRQMRIITMTIIFAVALVGNSVVLYKICSGKDKKRKINFLIAQLALADLCVSVLTLLSQIVWELLEDEWLAGDVSCRIFKVFQVSGLIASSNIIAIIALERHHVIMNPLSSPLPTRCFAGLGWLLAFLLSVPQGFVFKAVSTEEGRRCWNVFGQLPRWHVQVYIIYSSVTVFFLPFCILTVAYSRILWIVWGKAKSSKAEKQPNGACELQASKKTLKLVATNSCIPRAKVKTLKMTLVIIILFVVCGLPYFVVEMKIAFGTITGLDKEVMAVLGIFVVTNSAVNPYVYIFFKTNNVFLRRLEKKMCFCCCLHERRKPTFRMQLFPSSTPTHKHELSSTTTSEVEECSVLHRSLFLQAVAPGDKRLGAQCESCM
ncbi:probable G-protein coupled receptor 150 [Pseudophryne corroboree]|uniref:probable G-protein coupled receptor 150 n=1 Tax=Pseudophryne corroboree TaxID=495146 RepID=UPI00308184F7